MTLIQEGHQYYEAQCRIDPGASTEQIGYKMYIEKLKEIKETNEQLKTSNFNQGKKKGNK